MTPEQWWQQYGTGLGAEDEWASGVLAVVDQTWSTEIADICSPYTTLVGGGWDVGAAAAMDLLTVDWTDASAVGTMLTSIIGSVVGEAIGTIASNIPIIGAVASVMGIWSDAIAAETARHDRAVEAEQRAERTACLANMRANHDVRGTGPGGSVLPCDWWIQADFGPDMRPVATGRTTSIGQMFDAMLLSWPVWKVEDAAAYAWNTFTDPLGWPRSEYPTPEAFFRAALGAYGETELADFYARHGAAERWSSSWLAQPKPAHAYRTEWPHWLGLADPLRTLRAAIVDQSAALRPRDYVDGGRALQPLWFDFWRTLTKVPEPGRNAPAMPFAALQALYGPAAVQWNQAAIVPISGAPASPFVHCGCDGLAALVAIESGVDRWTSQVFPAYGPDQAEYAAQLAEGWMELDAFIRGKLGRSFGAVSQAARRPGLRQTASTIVAEGLREIAVSSGSISADAAAQALDRDEQERAARRYSFAQKIGAVGLGTAAAVAIGAAAWRR